MKGIEGLPLKYILIVLVAVIVISAILGITRTLTNTVTNTTSGLSTSTTGATLCSLCKVNATTGQKCVQECNTCADNICTDYYQ